MGIVTPLTVIGEQVAGSRAAAVKRLESLVYGESKNTFEMAELLWEIKKQNMYSANFATFSDWIRASFPGTQMTPQRAQYLSKMAHCMQELGIPRSTYERVGITKLRHITRLDPHGEWLNPMTGELLPLAGFIHEFMTKALTMTVDEVLQHVHILEGRVGDQATVHLNYYTTVEINESVIKPAMELARKVYGTVGRDDEGMAQDASDGKCLEIICINFLQDPANEILAGQA